MEDHKFKTVPNSAYEGVHIMEQNKAYVSISDLQHIYETCNF